MAENLGDAILRLSVDDRNLNKGLDKANSSASSRMSKVAGGMRKTGAAMSAAVTLPLLAIAKVGLSEIGQQQAALAQTQAVIKSTGGAARVSAKHVSGMAESLANLTGIEDDAIQAGENMLLTFTNIQNRTGKGNKIFDQATSTITDMAVALGTDPKTAALQLGKALNDPVKGMTRLQRIGVTFTDKQKDTVSALMKSGKTAQAQKVILKELNKEFGGSAKAFGETMPGKIAKAKKSFEDLSASFMEQLLPGIMKLMEFATKLMAKFDNLSPNTKKVIAILGVLAAAIGPVLMVVGTMIPALTAVAGALGAVSLPVVGVVAGVIALGAAFIFLWKKSETFRMLAKALWKLFLFTPMGVGIGLMIKLAKWIQKTVKAFGGWKLVFIKISIEFLKMVNFLMKGAKKAADTLGKMPGPMGKKFRAASKAIGHDMKGVQGTINKLSTQKARLEADRLTASVRKTRDAALELIRTLARASVAGVRGGLGIAHGATGAIVRRPTLALIGEAGPEAVVPLNRTRGNDPLPRSMGGNARGFNVKELHVHDVNLDPALIFRKLAWQAKQVGAY